MAAQNNAFATQGARRCTMATLAQIVVDCRHPASLARFWAEALDDFVVRDYDAAEIARLAGLGFDPESDPCVLVDGPSIEICFQKTDDLVSGTRLHLDITSDDRHAEVDQLVLMGAAVVQQHAGHTWMADPEGNNFCVADG